MSLLVAHIDGLLDQAQHRDMYGKQEVRDLLLDLRAHAQTLDDLVALTEGRNAHTGNELNAITDQQQRGVA